MTLPPTVDSIEVVILVVATLACFCGGILFAHAVRTANDAVQDGRPESVLLLLWLRVANESLRLLLAILVLAAGILQASIPTPASPSFAFPYFQAIWLLLGLVNVTLSLMNEAVIRRVTTAIERETRLREE